MRQRLPSMEEEAFDIAEQEIEITPAHLRKLARIRKNLESLGLEITDKILQGAKECRAVCTEALELVEDAHNAATPKSTL